MQAFQNLARNKMNSGKTSIVPPSTTHNYVRFAPENEDQLIELHNYGYDLYDTPLDQDVTTDEYYHDPA